jgi:hypothetical protein
MPGYSTVLMSNHDQSAFTHLLAAQRSGINDNANRAQCHLLAILLNGVGELRQRGSRGSPSPRSAMTLRWISFEPP